MRILMVNKFHYLRGGSETYHFAVAAGLRALGHDVGFFAMQDPRNFPCDQSRYFVRNVDYADERNLVDSVRDGLSLVYSVEAREKFNALVEEFRPDVIHLNLVHRQITFSILDAPAVQGIPVVYTAHDYIPVCPNCTFLDAQGVVCEACLGGNFRNCARKRCVKGSLAKSILATVEAEVIRAHGSYGKIDCFIAPSQFMRQKLIEGGMSASRIKVMRNFVSNADASFGEARSQDEKYFLYVGRLSSEKDLDTLIVGFAGAVDSLPGKWRLAIAGDGPERERLETAVSRSSCSESIRFLGHIERREVEELLDGATAVVVSSKCYENAPYAIAEAYSHGVPVIGARIGGIGELVQECETGYSFQPGDVQGLSDALVRVATMPQEQYVDMSRKCLGFARDNLSEAEYMHALVNLYQSLIDRRRGCAVAAFA